MSLTAEHLYKITKDWCSGELSVLYFPLMFQDVKVATESDKSCSAVLCRFTSFLHPPCTTWDV